MQSLQRLLIFSHAAKLFKIHFGGIIHTERNVKESMAISIPKNIIGGLFLTALLASACQPASMGVVTETTAANSAPTVTRAPATLTPVSTVTLTQTIPSTVEPNPTRPIATQSKFPEEIYPPALPLQFGAWPATSGCPNPAGLQEADDLPVDVVVQVVSELLFSEDIAREKEVSDQALWPLLPLANRGKTGELSGVEEGWIDTVLKASESEYAQLVINQCGEKTAGVTWVAKICPGPCESNSSESLKDDLFFVKRNERWLAWAIY